MRNKVLLLLLVTVLSLHSVRAFAASPSAEPDIADYTAPPTFMINSIEPNIMIILDNSGSMNYNAYGIWPGNGKLVTGNSFTGSPYDTNTHFDVRVSDSRDDAEESSGSAYYATGDLYLGRWDDARPTYVGIRFQNVAIPQGVKVQRAYIEFNVNSPKIPPYDGKIFLKIQGEDVDDAAQYSAVANGISGRAKTKTAVPWSNSTSPDLEPWGPANEKQETADIASIVQEILDRDGWASGNAINFIISYHTGMGSKNRRDATAYDGDPANAPLLHIEYTSDEIQEYYGYFNPNWFYTYSSNKFIHKYEKVCRIETNKDVYYSIDYGESCNEPGIILADDEHIKSARYDYDKSCTVQTDPVPDAWYVADTSGVKKCLTDADISSAGESLWDGNWMNWVSMRRIDVARKVLMGGLATSRTGGGNQTLFGEKPAQTDRVFWKQFDSSTSPALTPYDGKYKYKLQEGYIYVFDAFDTQKAKLTLGVEADEAYESWEFVDGNISGVLQKFGDRAEWGNEFFYYGSGKDQEGGKISNRIGTNLTTLITDLQNTGADTWTPLAEAYYVAMQYFKQEKPDASLGYSNSAIGAVNNTNDPFYRDAEFVSCPKNFVLMLTDGSSTEDKNIPAFLKNYDGDNHEDSSHADYRSYGDNGSDYLDDIALYGRTNDLRVDLEGNQNLIFFPVYAFGDDANARKLLKDAARNGGFVDKNANNRPDGDYTDSDAERLEWDTDGDGIPDTYFEAKDGKVLRKALEKAINAMLERASSGTAVSVLATSSEGEGNVVQAYFKPTIKTGDDEARWVGYLQSVWLDSKGNLREDTIADKALKIAEDKVLSYTVAADGNTEVYKYAVSESHPYPDFESDVPDVVAMEDIVPLWEAGVMLAARNLDAFPRTIFTYIDDAAVPKDIAGKGVKFHADNAAWIKPYLGIKNNSTWSYLGSNHDERAANLIHYVAGYDPGSSKIDAATTNMRTRVVNGQVWKLGDIVNSTPVTVDGPPERFDVIYSDFGYHEFYEFHRNRADRETMVYVGGNDGMLHAFTSWQYDSRDKEFKLPPATFDGIGAELWGFIPQSLLPHLKWLPHQGYNHVYYVDLQPKVTAAQIFYNILGDPSSGTLVEPVGQEYHKNGWGVMLLGGLRMGGKDIKVTDDFDYDSSTADTTKTVTSSYFALDISNPRVPKVLWEKTFTDLEFTTSVPGIIKVGNKWYAVISSGPETYDGTSNKKGHVYILDLATGVPYQGTGPTDWFFETDHTDAFLSTAVGLDKRLNYNVDAVYFGEAHDTGNPDGWKGSAYRVGIPWVCSVADCTQVEYGDTVNGAYVTNPNDGLNPWYLSRLFDSPAPITAPVSLSIDGLSNAWVFFGTGRYFSQADKTTMDTQYLFGIKDPFFNRAYTTAPDDYYLNYTKNLTLDLSRFFDADTYKVSYPWGYIEAPAGDCSLVPTGQIGDIYGTGTIGETYSPGSCVCEYAWPAVSCTEVTVGRCAAVNPANELFDDGDCICIPFQVPQWGTVEYVVGGCAGVAEGRVGDVNSDGSCKGLYWRASGAVDISCLGVPFGTIGNPIPALYGGDGTCVGENVTVPAWNCTARPAGNCPDPAVDPDFYVGKTGDFLGDGGSCYSNYWRAREAVENSGACDSVDYTLHTGMFGPAGDGDYFGNGSCKTSFVPKEVPEAIVTNTTSNETLTFKEMLLLARATDGWVRILDIPGERSVTKPTLLGGAGLFTTYVPNTDICGFGGTSYLWGLYYESGTAYQKPILGTEIIDGVERPIEKLRLGVGMASSVAVHVGDQGGKSAKGFIQTSTGAMLGKDVETPLRIRSGFISWMEEE